MENIIKRAVVGLLTAALLSMPVFAYEGVDVSHWDGTVDFSAVKAGGHGDFAIIKVSDGTNYTDPQWQTLTAGAIHAGVPFGFYHYFHPGSDTYGAAQAEYFASKISNLDYDVVPAVDVEETDGCSNAQLQSSLRAFIDRFTALTGVKPMIYASTAFINEHIGGGFTDCGLWQAQYASAAGNVAGWGHNYTVWQYTGDKVYIAGINTTVDLDTANSGVYMPGKLPGSSTSTTRVPEVLPNTVYSGFYVADVLPLSTTIPSTAKTDFDVRDSYGTAIPGRQVDAGDTIYILSVDYGSQLAEVLYPCYGEGCWRHGYIRNLQQYISNPQYNAWQNGGTDEPVYNAGGARIGTIYPHERATIIGHVNGRTHVLYSTGKGTETKDGYVAYAGR